MKTLDISRLVNFNLAQTVVVASNILKTVSGVTATRLAVYAAKVDQEKPVLFNILEPGRFTFELRCSQDVALSFVNLSQGEPSVSLLWPAEPTVLYGDPENSFTKVGHRPAINPEMQQVMQQMRLMEHSMAVMASQTQRAQMAAQNAQKAAQARQAAEVVDKADPGVAQPDKAADPVVEPSKQEPKKEVTDANS